MKLYKGTAADLYLIMETLHLSINTILAVLDLWKTSKNHSARN